MLEKIFKSYQPNFDKLSGFSLIELVLVVALMMILGTMGTGVGQRFMTQNAVSNASDQLVNQLRKAQLGAMMGKQNSNWGVNYATNTITLYRGNSFATRVVSFDERFTVNTGVSITGFTDVNFARETGKPNVTPTITITGSGTTRTIILNSQGMVTR